MPDAASGWPRGTTRTTPELRVQLALHRPCQLVIVREAFASHFGIAGPQDRAVAGIDIGAEDFGQAADMGQQFLDVLIGGVGQGQQNMGIIWVGPLYHQMKHAPAWFLCGKNQTLSTF